MTKTVVGTPSPMSGERRSQYARLRMALNAAAKLIGPRTR